MCLCIISDVDVGDPCTTNEECEASDPESDCEGGVCECTDNHYLNGGECLPRKNLH